MKMNKFKLGFSLLKQNYKSILLFDLIYKLVATALFVPLLVGMLNFAMYMAGMKYISNDNIFNFLLKPTTLLIAVVILIALAMIMIVEITATVACYHASYYKQKISVADMFHIGFRSALRMFRGRNLLIIVYVLVLLPITSLTFISSYASSITIPDFVSSYIESNRYISVIIIIFLLGLSVIAVRWLFSIHFYVNENMSFKEARKKSLEVNQKRYVRNVLQLILWNIIIAVVIILIACLGILAIAVVIKVFSTSKVALSVTLAITAAVVILIYILVANFIIPIMFAFISAMYYQDKFNKGEDIPAYHSVLEKHKRFKKISLIVVICACLVNMTYVEIISDNSFNFHVQFLDRPVVSAHRGDSVSAPENTIPAFESAIANRADYAELDVQQTKDGVIVVMHDSNLKRTTGVNKNIWEVTYDEIKDLDAGSWFSKEYAGTKIPTLDEVLKLCKGEIRLNIELKPTGHEVDFEKSVVDVIYENEFETDCVIASMKYSTLEKVKEYAPEFTTVYVTTVAYGSIQALEYADVFSIESTFATSSMVNRLHEQGKLVYAWTVNNEDKIQAMIDVGVDSIITDNPVLARELIYSKSLNDTIVEFITSLFK